MELLRTIHAPQMLVVDNLALLPQIVIHFAPPPGVQDIDSAGQPSSADPLPVDDQ